MDKIAILILGHKNPNQLSKLVSSLANSHFDFYIHIDKKVDILPFQKSLENLKDMNFSFVKDRIKTYFFDFSLVEATCKCAAMAYKSGNYKYYILLSGQDYPIKSKDYIYGYLIKNYPMCWIDMYGVDEAAFHGVNWVKNIGYFYTSQHLRKIILNIVGNKFYFSKYGKLVKLFAVIYDRIMTLIKGAPRDWLKSTQYTYSAGSHFWILPDIAIEHILNNYFYDINLKKIFSHIGAPEESYFQTSLSTMKDLLLPDEFSQFESSEKEMDNPALRLIKWYSNGVKTNGHPDIWKITDKDFIDNANALFARKFDMNVDVSILNYLDSKC